MGRKAGKTLPFPRNRDKGRRARRRAGPVGGGPTPPAGKWTRETLRAHLRALHAAGVDLSTTAMRQGRTSVVNNARALFGTYADAVEAAGIDYASVARERRRTPQAIIDELRERQRARKSLAIRPGDRESWSLYLAARKKFGSYANALAAAGIDPDTVYRRPRKRPVT